MNMEIEKTLVDAAVKALDRSYSPYSGFKVGAALLAKSGKIYTGANIESASFTPTVCAERVAFFSAIHAGEKEFSKIAIVGGKEGVINSLCPPCGVCGQVMVEFCEPSFEVILSDGETIKVMTLGQLMPESFTKSNI